MTHERDWTHFYQLAEMIARVCFVQRKSRDAWDEQVTFLFELLSEYAFDDVRNAMLRHVKTQKFFPTPADVTRLIEGDPEERASVAWRMFLRALSRCGYYDSVVFPDPAYHYAVEQFGGWERIGREWHSLTDREIEFRRAEWRKLYEIGLRVASWDKEPGKVMVLRYLPGFYERDNREGGREEFIPGVVEVGTWRAIDRAALCGTVMEHAGELPLAATGTES